MFIRKKISLSKAIDVPRGSKTAEVPARPVLIIANWHSII